MGLRHPVGGATAGAVGSTYRVAKTHRMPGGAESGERERERERLYPRIR